MTAMGVTFGMLCAVLLAFAIEIFYAWYDGDWRKALQQTAVALALAVFWGLVYLVDWNLAQKFSAAVGLVIGLLMVVGWLEKD